MEEAIVAVVRCEDYSEVGAAVRKAVGLLGGMERFVAKGARVMLKPNLCDPQPPEKAATTHPELVRAVAKLALERSPNVCIGEQAAHCEPGVTLQAAEVSGIAKVAKELKIKFRDLQSEGFIAEEIKDYKVLEKTDFCAALSEQDVVINLPKFKTHGLSFVTGAVKNCFGLIHPEERGYLHSEFPDRGDFNQGVVDIFSHVRPKLTVMDAVVCMEGDEGPSYGEPKKVGYVIASEDGVAADAVASHITGHNPMAVLTTKTAHERGLGVGDIDRIKIVGDKIEVVKDFNQHSSYRNRMKESRGRQPFITEKCVRCGACFRKCPVKAIKDVDGKYVIDKSKCIRCYCCLEVCVHGAVGLEKVSEAKLANIRLGLECNHSCLFCTIADDQEEALKTEEAKRKIDELAGQGVEQLTFTGGEPTIREDLVEIIGYAKKRGIRGIDLQSNGAMLAEVAFVERLKEAGLNSALIALHSHEREVSNKLTCSKDYDKTVMAIKNCLKAGLNVSVSHVITEENYRSLLDFAKFIKELSPKIVLYFGLVRPNGRARQNPAVVPRLWKVERTLSEVMGYCEGKGLGFSVEGVPLCYMRGFERYSAETQRMAKAPQIYAAKGESGHENLHEFIHSKLKMKDEVCKLCLANEICAGVWKEYGKMYGTKELYPIFERVKL